MGWNNRIARCALALGVIGALLILFKIGEPVFVRIFIAVVYRWIQAVVYLPIIRH